ncbi:MAG: hypothetical protein C5B59_13725 [Bacteroidetes bacterium]|nr:MAG: hypothetical protein C5B59_13725 [Bacteroidota bacterium]
MSQLNDIAIFSALKQAGIPSQDQPAFYALAISEATGDPNATGPVIHSNDCSNGQQAIGLFQIVLACHPDVSRSCALDPVCAAKKAYAISGNGTNFSPWSSFGNQTYKDAFSKGKSIVATLYGITHVTDPITGSTPVLGGVQKAGQDVLGIPGQLAQAGLNKISEVVKSFAPIALLAVAFIVVLIMALAELRGKAVQEILPVPKSQ